MHLHLVHAFPALNDSTEKKMHYYFLPVFGNLPLIAGLEQVY